MKPADSILHTASAGPGQHDQAPGPAALVLDAVRVVHRAADRRPAQAAVDSLSLRLAAGEIGCLLGPSGCGKTTLLRAIAGFEPLQSGTVSVGGAVLSSPTRQVPPERRGVGMMFQEVALFPHLDAARNIGFGLRRQPRDARTARVAELLALVGLAELGHRFPHELSGGQQQRVALARALAPSPALLLLDEPFSSLDTATRQRLSGEVRQILGSAGQTALLVTHDPAEARAVGDWIGTMAQGRLLAWERATPGTVSPPDAHGASPGGRFA